MFACFLGKKEAYVADARKDTGSRNVFRHEDLKDAVKLERVRNHFICKLLLMNILFALCFSVSLFFGTLHSLLYSILDNTFSFVSMLVFVFVCCGP